MNIWSECERIPLPQLLSFIVDNRGKTVPTADDGTHKLIATNCIRNENLYPSYEKIRWLSDETYNTWFRAHPLPGDIIFVCKGTPGRVCMVPDPIDFCIAQDMIAFRVNESRIYNRYLLAVLRSREMQEQIANTSVGDVIPHFKKQFLNQLLIPVPPIDVQKRIGDLYFSFALQEELNKKINANLSEQAQTVLNHYMESNSYSLKPLSDIADVIDCLHSKKPDAVKDSMYQLIQLDNIRDDGFLDLYACKYMISKSDYDNWTRKCEIIEGDCVITNVGRIGAVSQAPFGTRAAMGRNMTCIRLKQDLDLYAYFITVLLSRHMRRQIQINTDEGTIMGALNVKNIPKLLFPIFDPPVMTELESTIQPVRKAIEYNNLQNQSLARAREKLVPKIMNGKIDVFALPLNA